MIYRCVMRTNTLVGILLVSSLLAACASTPVPVSPTGATAVQPVTLTVSAASDLTYAFGEIGKQFEAETGHKVVFNFGSTGQLTQQIEQGAPVDVFAAANVSFVEDLERQGLILPDTKQLYARGRITLWTRADSPLQITSLADLTRPEVRRIAIANPDHAPYGVAARQAMQTAGIWEAVQSKLVLGENVRQTLQYAETGNVDVAIVALSLSVPAAGGTSGRWTLIPQDLHPPIDQALAVIKGTKHEAAARAFATFVNGPQGRQIMRKYGLVLPGEEPDPMNWQPLLLSLQVTAVATVLMVVCGLPLALLLARRRFRGAALVETLVSLPLVLPPTVVGYYLLLVLGRGSPTVEWFGWQILFTWGAAAIASAIMGFPLFVLISARGHRRRRSGVGARRAHVGLVGTRGDAPHHPAAGATRHPGRPGAGGDTRIGRIRRDLDGRRQHPRDVRRRCRWRFTMRCRTGSMIKPTRWFCC